MYRGLLTYTLFLKLHVVVFFFYQLPFRVRMGNASSLHLVFFFVNRCAVCDDMRWLSEGEKSGLLTTDRKPIGSSFYYPDLGLENLEYGY